MFYANKGKKRFHLIDCEYAGEERAHQSFWTNYDTHEEAIAAGKVPCRFCKPCEAAEVGIGYTEVNIPGIWTKHCISTNRDGCYAAFYTFTLDKETNVDIYLRSDNDVDPYLYLLLGENVAGQVVAENDDFDESLDSRITSRLYPGTYTIEATTFYPEQEGPFVLDITFD